MLHRTFKASFVALCLCMPYVVVALPQDAEVVSGGVNIQQPDNNNLVIHQSTDKAIINWQQFNIGSGESTRFIVPNANSLTLNRVVGANASQILGLLESNGQLWLINPNGIIFGPQAQVNVAALIASTLNIQDQDFLKGNYQLQQLQNAQLAKIVNQGTIVAADHGLIALLAPQVQNSGIIIANLGSIAIGTGTRATVNLAGNQLLSFSVEEGEVGDFYDQNGNHIASLSNAGQITANGGKILLTARNIDTVLNQSINTSGIIQANTVSQQGGKIILTSAGDTIVSGNAQILAKGENAGEQGGEIQVLGNRVAVVDNANLNASGQAGGGQVLIGGDYQGSNPNIQNAEYTTVAKNVTIAANAGANGDGGKVIVWSNQATRFYGSIEAQGGAQSGNGGFVETSGKRVLDIAGARVNTIAANGIVGTWLLDPTDITICSNCTSDGAFSIGSNPSIFAFSPADPNAANIDVADIVAGLDTNNLVITTASNGQGTGNITVSAPINYVGSAGHSLSLFAEGQINVNALITDANGSGTLDLILTAGQAGGGNVTLAAPINVRGSVTAQGGKTGVPGGVAVGDNVSAGGDITLSSYGAGGITFSPQGSLNTAAGDITLTKGIGANMGNAFNLGNVNSGGALDITNTSGAIAQMSGTALHAQGLTTVTVAGTASPVNLSESGNDFASIAVSGAATNAGMAVSIADANALTLENITATQGNITIQAGGLLYQNGTITAGNSGGVSLRSSSNTAGVGVSQSANAGIVTSGAVNIVLIQPGGNLVNLAGNANNFGALSVNATASTPINFTLNNLAYGAVNTPNISFTNSQDFKSFALILPNFNPSDSGAQFANFLNTLFTTNIPSASTFNLGLTLAGYTSNLSVGAGGNINTITELNDLTLHTASNVTARNMTAHGTLDLATSKNTGSVVVTGVNNTGGSAVLTKTGTGLGATSGHDIFVTGNSILNQLQVANYGTGDVNITNPADLIINSFNVDHGSVVISSSGAIVLTGLLDASNNALSLTATNIVDNAGAGSIYATGGVTLDVGSGDIHLTNLSNAFGNSSAVIIGHSGVGAGNINIAANSSGLVLNQAASSLSALTVATNGGPITQATPLTVTGETVLNAGLGNITLNNTSNSLSGLTIFNANNVTLTNTGALTLRVTNIGNNFTLTTGGDISQTDVMTIGGNTVIDAGANGIVSFNNAGNDFNNITISQAAGAIIFDSNALNVGDINLTGGLTIGSNGTFTQTGTFNVGGNEVIGTNGGNAALNTTNVGGYFTLTTDNGNVTQTGPLNVAGSIIFFNGTGALTLTNTANDFSAMAILGAGNISVVDANALALTTVQSTGNVNFTVNAGGDHDSGLAIQNGGGIDATGHNVTLTNLSNTVSGNSILLNDGSLSANNLTLNSNSGIVSAHPGQFTLTVPGTTTVNATGSANTVSMQNPANDFGTVTLTHAGNVFLADANSLILGAGTIGGDFNLTTAGNISQSGALSVAGASVIDATGGNVTLNNTNNNFNAISVLNGNAVSLFDTNDLAINAIQASGNVSILAANGTLTFNNGGAIPIQLTGNSTQTLVLSASQFANNYSGGVSPVDLGAGSGSRWVFFLSHLGNNTFGGGDNTLASGNQAVWNTAYNNNLSGLPSGNRYVFTTAPALTLTPLSTPYSVSKYYGDSVSLGMPTATGVSPNYQVNGIVNAADYNNAFIQDTLDNITFNDSGLSYASNGTSVNANASQTPYAITMSGSATVGNGYTVSYDSAQSFGDVTVAARPITLTADNQSRYYGDNNPTTGTYTITSGDLVNGDTANNLIDVASNATTVSDVGNYDLSGSNVSFTAGSASNYDIQYANGNLEVNARPITLTASDQSRYYGDNNPTSGGYTISRGNLVNGDTLSDTIAVSSAADNAANVGSYDLNGSNASFTAGAASNYDIQYANGNLEVNARPITLTASDQSRNYGDNNPTSGGYSISSGSLANSDTLNSTINVASNATTISNVGNYNLTGSNASFSSGSAGNYDIQYVNGNLQVNARPITLTANDQSRYYGDNNPTSGGYTITSGSLANSDTLNSMINVASSATTTSNVGNYNLTGSNANFTSGSANNYAVSYGDGTLEIVARPITIGVTGSSVYGNAVAASATGSNIKIDSGNLVNSDTLSSVAYNTNATNTSNVGTAYTTTATGQTFGAGNAGNYAISYSNDRADSYSVTARPITITANDADRTYGDVNLSFGYALTNGSLVNGNTISSVNLATSATATSTVGNYNIVSSAASINDGNGGNNYNVTYANGGLTVNQAPLTITADDASRLYGEPNPAFPVTYAGFRNSDDSSVVSGLTVGTPAISSSLAGNYPIIPANATAQNYSMSFVNGVLTVTGSPAPAPTPSVSTAAISPALSQINPGAVNINTNTNINFNMSPVQSQTISTGSMTSGVSTGGAMNTSSMGGSMNTSFTGGTTNTSSMGSTMNTSSTGSTTKTSSTGGATSTPSTGSTTNTSSTSSTTSTSSTGGATKTSSTSSTTDTSSTGGTTKTSSTSSTTDSSSTGSTTNSSSTGGAADNSSDTSNQNTDDTQDDQSAQSTDNSNQDQ